MKIYTTQEILNKLDWCIRYKIPFSHIRFGDGGIKFIHSILFDQADQLDVIISKEGLPRNKITDVLDLWGYYARQADFIDTPEVYFNKTFWPRIKGPQKAINVETKKKLQDWRELYNRAEFDNENYCNPESNCLFILDIPSRINIFDLMKNRKICIICAKPQIKNILFKYDINILKIVGQWQNHYDVSFKKIGKEIERTARNYDFWMVAAGELGRIYTGMIKQFGGRAIDIGFVIDFWTDNYLHPRFYKFLCQGLSNRLELRLTDEGKQYMEYI